MAELKDKHECCSSCCNHSHEEVGSLNQDHDHGASCGCGIAHEKDNINRTFIFLAIALVSLIVSFLNLEIFHYFDPAWIAVILCGYPIFKGAFSALKNERQITSALLISVAIIASIALEVVRLSGMMGESDGHGHGYIFAAGEIAFLMGVGGLIEEWTVRKARSGIEKLMKLAPTTVRIKSSSGIIETEIENIKIGDIAVIKPGEIIGVDGEIIMGTTSVDQSSVTGESVPVDKNTGDSVFSGTMNKNGAIEVRITKEVKDMTVNKLISLVEEAEGKKSPISRLADKWASYIVPTAIAVAFIVFGLTYFVFDLSLIDAVIRGVTILVVFCPCSLSLATPTAVAAGIGNGSGRGILIKSGAAIEELAKVKTVAFDKTGTLTEGDMKVVEIFSPEMEEKEFRILMASAESYSDHPIAKAITRFAQGENLIEPSHTEAIVGIGAKSVIGDKEVILCAYDKIHEVILKYAEGFGSFTEAANKGKNISIEYVNKSREFFDRGETVIGSIVNGKLVGLIGISDTLRKETKSSIEKLKAEGYDVIMLTGDNEKSARIMSEAAGNIDFKHSLLPEDKLKLIEELKTKGKVCMIGDGINDTPALAIADASVAMGALGSDAAIETADVSLMTSDIGKVPDLLRLSKEVLFTIKRNIGISMTINVLAVILSTMGVLNPVTGAIVHNISSVFVVLSSALILTKK